MKTQASTPAPVFKWTRAAYDEWRKMFVKELLSDGEQIGEIGRRCDGREWYGCCRRCDAEIRMANCRSAQKAYLEHCRFCTERKYDVPPPAADPEPASGLASPERHLSEAAAAIARRLPGLAVTVETEGGNSIYQVVVETSAGIAKLDAVTCRSGMVPWNILSRQIVREVAAPAPEARPAIPRRPAPEPDAECNGARFYWYRHELERAAAVAGFDLERKRAGGSIPHPDEEPATPRQIRKLAAMLVNIGANTEDAGFSIRPEGSAALTMQAARDLMDELVCNASRQIAEAAGKPHCHERTTS